MRQSSPRLALAICGLLSAAGCNSSPAPSDAAPAKAPAPVAKPAPEPTADTPAAILPSLTAAYLSSVTRELSDDEMGGRRPGTPGASKAVEYIVAQMKAAGLKPGGENGKWTQRVPMRATATAPDSVSLKLERKGKAPLPLAFGPDIVGGTFLQAGEHPVDAPLVFAGYGITAPEYKWDDYAGIDMTGRIAVVLVGDPPVEDGRFAGSAMTYYGRWTYKYERALEAGAAGCLVIHETEPASYGWNVVHNSWSRERFHVVEPGGELPDALPFQGWISKEAAEQVAVLEKTNLAAWHERAMTPGFRAFTLGTKLTGTFTTTERRVEDVNVVGRLPGAAKAEEYVLMSAHWDHLGTADADPSAPDADRIFNGAVDNASGIAGMLGVAAQLVTSEQPPARSVVFLATTAEEQGLLGAKYYASHPTVPLEKIVAAANIDSMNVAGRTKNIQVVGMGQSSLEDALAIVAKDQGRVLVPDERPEAGGYYRSDHFAFAKRGVPAIYFRGGKDMEDGGTARGEELAKEKARHYHTVEDAFDPAWTFEGALQDAQAMAALILAVANGDARPTWKPASEFARVRPAP